MKAQCSELVLRCIIYGFTLAVAIALLLPGLHGGFYLDDFANLSGLASIDDSWHSVLSYLANVPVGNLGRPISYLTFVIQSESWPGNPFSFKLFNLSIHLFNGVLIAAVARLIYSHVFEKKLDRKTIDILSALAAFFWVVLPLNMSSVFYVVQRMTLLSSSMVLIALLGFLYLRVRSPVWSRRQYLLATMFIGFGYLGILAKESAVLVGVLVLAVNVCVFSTSPRKLNRLWQLVVLVAPLCVVGVYLFATGKVTGGYSYRDFSMTERLLSQTVILFDYFFKIVFPTNARINLFNDGFPFRDVVDNWPLIIASTFSLLAIIVISLRQRRTIPLVSFGVIFFLAGHLLESTLLPLELYFEHRNYLPSVGVVVGAVGAVGFLVIKFRQTSRLFGFLLLAVSLSWGGWLGLVSSVEAKTWGDLRAFAIAAVTERPNSLRARQEMAAYYLAAKDYMGAANLLYSINSDFGIYAGTYAQLLMLKCFQEDVPLPGKGELIEIFETAPYDRGVGVALQDLRELKNSSDCTSVASQQLLDIVNTLLQNPAYENRSNFYVLKALFLVDNARWIEAAQTLESIPKSRLSTSELILAARFYNYGGEEERAYSALNKASESAVGLIDQLVYENYIEQLRQEFQGESNRSIDLP